MIAQRFYMLGYTGVCLPRSLRRLIAKSAWHSAWLDGMMWLLAEEGRRMSVCDRQSISSRKGPDVEACLADVARTLLFPYSRTKPGSAKRGSLSFPASDISRLKAIYADTTPADLFKGSKWISPGILMASREDCPTIPAPQHVVNRGASIGRFMDLDIPAWIETAAGTRYEFAGVCAPNLPVAAIARMQQKSQLVFESRLIFQRVAA